MTTSKPVRQPSRIVMVIAETQYRLDGHREPLKAAEPWLKNQYLKNAKAVAKALDKEGVLPVSRETPADQRDPRDPPQYAPGSPYLTSLLQPGLSRRR